jgi:hypothetical protein
MFLSNDQTHPDPDTSDQSYPEKDDREESSALSTICQDGNTPENIHNNATGPSRKADGQTFWRRAVNLLLWTPPWCRWNPENPPKFGLPLNFLFAFAGTFTVRETEIYPQ